MFRVYRGTRFGLNLVETGILRLVNNTLIENKTEWRDNIEIVYFAIVGVFEVLLDLTRNFFLGFPLMFIFYNTLLVRVLGMSNKVFI